MKKRYALYEHIGVYWNGGIHLMGIYRWAWLARLHGWFHTTFVNQFRLCTVSEIVQGAPIQRYYKNEKDWEREMKVANDEIAIWHHLA